MNKMKYLLIMIMAALVSTSCADDNDFFSLLGTWENPPRLKSNGPVFKMSPKNLSDDCETHIFITFNKDLSGILDKHSNCADYELVDFEWSIKGDELTIIFGQESENNWDIISGTNTFDISGYILTIKGEETITELSSHNFIN